MLLFVSIPALAIEIYNDGNYSYQTDSVMFVNNQRELIYTLYAIPTIKDKYYKAKDIMKLTILVKALVGGVYTRQGRSGEAEFFIINDNSQGKYRVFNMYDIVRKIEENMTMEAEGQRQRKV